MKKIKNWLDFFGTPVILGCISVFAYFISYQYQVGYLSYFGISNQFISLDINNIINSLLATVATLSIVFNIPQILDKIKTPLTSRNLLHELSWAAYGIYISSTIVTFSIDGFDIKKNFLEVAIIVFFPIAFLLYKKNEKVKSFFNLYLEPDKESFLYKKMGINYTVLMVYILIIYTIINVFSRVGYYKAGIEKYFDIACVDQFCYALITRKDDFLLLLPLDQDKKTFKKELHIFTIEDFSSRNGFISLEKKEKLNLQKE